jgi:NADPH:quinone reductase-like Zn-dependent oxidoreductase
MVIGWLQPDGCDPDLQLFGRAEDFMRTPLDEMVESIAAGTMSVKVGKVFRIDDIVEAHRVMEENNAGGKIVVLT